MHVIYLDVLFAINLVINYVLLLLTGEKSGIYAKRFKILLGAGSGALFSVLMFFCDFNGVATVVAKVLFCVAVTVITFGKEAKGRIVKLSIIFCAMSFVLGGAVMALGYFGGTNGFLAVKNGVPYINISIKLLFLATAVSYGVLSLIFSGSAMKIGKQTSKVQICLGSQCITMKALSDSGNLLQDPLSGKMIIVIGKNQAAALFGGKSKAVIEELSENTVVDCYEKLVNIGEHKFGVIPYRNSSTTSGILLTVKVNSITVDGRAECKYLLGIAPTDIEAADGCRAIMGI